MPKAVPQPRYCRFMGMHSPAHVNPDGTWLEAEEMCYPSGAMIRRAYVECEDGKLRVAVCGVADTFFSIPARVRVNGKSVRGFISCKGENNDTFAFTALRKKETDDAEGT